MANSNTETEWIRTPPPSGPLWQRIAKVVYNPTDGSFFGRTSKRWGIVITFYLVFYAVLAAMFALCMGGLFLSLDFSRPSYTLHSSLIGANPGLTYRPRGQEGTVVEYSVEANSSDVYTSQLDEILEAYAHEVWRGGITECTSEDNFGFPFSPCIFIKLNKIFDWVPEYYDDVNNLPADMPDALQDYIKTTDKLKQVWVSCAEEGSNTNSSRIQYPWGMALLGRYPFQNVGDHPSPILAVTFTPPVNTPFTVRCRAWAKNIVYNKSIKEASGYTRIQLHIHDTNPATENPEENTT
ncbi:sodium/potassium-transporting ATPase subunit beta-1-like [Achroia grisella]|uniref:sodium/potassium-transporting ATPase subunit beta-1-like n=1 Tax=Achroia grisella TaxID=688607 RepID=UPI0027D2A0BD|nr:sodium/potassium-transporting ATPase subunit beta-1-like [Achroia grisella]XP_059058977.1 sodium/potassium-transporting ATPase subunit beta-1-like [Achroia grisella]